MNQTLFPTLTSEISDRSTEYGSLNIDVSSYKKKNPKFEKMRSSLKNSLFSTEKSHSLCALPVSQSLGINDDEKYTPTSDNAEQNHETGFSFLSRDKYRKPSKGSLFHKPNIPSICSIDKEIEEDSQNGSFRRPVSMTSIGLTPRNSGREEAPQEDSGLGECAKSNPRVEELKQEDSLIVEGSPYRKSQFCTRLPVPPSLDAFDSPARDPDYRLSIFQRDIESEVDEIKKDLDVETDETVHFIRGDFYSYYYEGDVLGEGTTGIVKKCTKRDTNEEVAVKVVQYRDDLEILTLIVKEFKNHRKLNHKNIIKVYDLYIDYFKKKIYTVMELANCKEMFDVLKGLGHYSEAVASGIFKQILAGINYLNHHGVCHRDLKPNNILVSDDGKVVKITDFNVSKFIDNNKKKFSYLSKDNYKMWTYTGTIAFTAPEVFLENEYTEAVDMWSAGAVLYTMLCGYQPFQAEYVYDLIELIKAGQYDFPADPWDNISKQAKSLVRHCLDVNPKSRYSPSDALMHPWIANCGKISNTNIPRTVYYFNRFHRRNTGGRKGRQNGGQKSTKNSTRHNQKKWKAGELGFTQALDLFNEVNHKDTQPNNECAPNGAAPDLRPLQPKRGKTNPVGLQYFHSGFPALLRLEKSLSFNTLEDPKGDGQEKCHEEQDDAEMSEGDQDIYRFFEHHQEMLDPSPKHEENKKNKKDFLLEGKKDHLKSLYSKEGDIIRNKENLKLVPQGGETDV